MKIKMKTLSAGPQGIRQPDSIHDVPESEAHELIASGHAVAHDPPPAAEPTATEESKPAAAAKPAKGKKSKTKPTRNQQSEGKNSPDDANPDGAEDAAETENE